MYVETLREKKIHQNILVLGSYKQKWVYKFQLIKVKTN